MPRTVSFATTFVLMLLLAACSKPTIDATSDESLKASVAKVRESLPESKRTEFDAAMQTLVMSQLNFGDVIAGKQSGENMVTRMRAVVNGKNAAEVIDASKHVAELRKAQERTQALAEIKELKARKAKAEAAKSELTKFEVIRSRFRKERREYLGDQPVIELTVRNGTGKAVSRAYFIGTLTSPNRQVPWLKDDFNYKIAGGIEPGEEKTWTLAPNMFSDWGRAEVPMDAVFTVVVVQLDGPDDSPIYSIRDFTAQDAERLNKLTKEYGRDGAEK